MSSSTYTSNNVVYTYTQGVPGSAYVSVSSDATGAITILKEFTLDDITYQVKSIAESAFEGNLLNSLTFPSDSYVTSIGNLAFSNCGITSINIPPSVITIGTSAFSKNNISSFTGGINLETIGDSAFSSNKILTLTIPNKVTTISNSAFQDNALNTILFLGSDVTTIGTSAFQNNSLTRLFIPKSVSSLGASAFRNNNLTEVYFFFVPTIGSNCFSGNNSTLKAFYLEGILNGFIITPSPFVTKQSKTLSQMLTNLLDEPGVSVETLANDDYTFDQLAQAQATAEQLFGYFDNIPSPVPLSSYIPYFSVSTLKTAKPSLTASDFKIAGAPIQQVFDQFKTVLPRLSSMIGAGYSVSQIDGNVIATPVLTISDFKQANANKKQVCDYFVLSLVIGAGYSVQEVIQNATTVPTIGNFKTANADIQQVFNQYGLSAMIGATYTVTQIADNVVTNTPTIANFKAVPSPIQEVYNYFGLTLMIGAEYIVSDVKAVITSLSYSDFVQALAQPWNLMTEFDYNLLLPNFTVSQIYTASSDSRVKASNKNLTAVKFQSVSAPIWQMLNTFSLANLIYLYTTQELVSTSQDGRVTVIGNQNLTLTNMKNASDELWQVMNYYSDLADLLQVGYPVANLISSSNELDENNNRRVTVLALQDLGNKLSSFVTANTTVINRESPSKLGDMINNFDLSALLGYYSVAELKTAKSSLTAGNFKDASAPIQQVFEQYGLPAMIAAFYTVEAVIAGVTPLQTIQNFKDASAPIQQVFNQYKTVLPHRLSEMIDVEYTVEEIVAGVTASPAIGIADFKDAGAPIQQVFTKYGLSAMIAAFYTVEQVVGGVTPLRTIQNFKDASAPIQQVFDQYKTVLPYRLSAMIGVAYTVDEIVAGVTASPAIGIADFKDAGAPIQQVFNKYGLPEMIAAFYTVEQVVGGVTPLQTITDFKLAEANVQQVFNKYGLDSMIDVFYTVEEVMTGVTINTPTIDAFKLAEAPIQEVYNHFTLSPMIGTGYFVSHIVAVINTLVYSDFYNQSLKTAAWNLMTEFDYSLLLPDFTVSQIYTASSDSRVKSSNKNLDAQSFKTHNAAIWQMLNTFQLNILTPLYTTKELFDASNEKDGSQNFLVTVTAYQELTADDMKGAGDSLPEMMNVYSLADLLQLDYSVAELVTASNDNLVTVAALQNLGTTTAITGGLARFFTANATVISNVQLSKLWNLVNYFDLSDLLGYYSVAQLNATSTDNRVSEGKKVTIARLKAADTAETYTQDMLTEFGLHALWDNQYTVSQLKPFNVTVAQFWDLRTYTEENHVNPTVQDLSTGGYVLQDLWNGIVTSDRSDDVATIYDGLVVKPTVAVWWALTNGKPTVQQLSDSEKYGLQELWDGIDDVSTIRTGLSPVPTVSDFRELTSPPTIQELFDGGYTLQDLWDNIVTSNRSNDVVTIYDGLTVKPTVAQMTVLNDGNPTVKELYESGKYTLQQLWDGFMSLNYIPVNAVAMFRNSYYGIESVTVSDFRGLTNAPTILDLHVGGFALEDLWYGIVTSNRSNDVVTIHDGLSLISTLTPTVSDWLNPNNFRKPTIQELYDSGIYGLQELWNGIVTSNRSNDVVTIHDGLTVKPSVYAWWTLANNSKPTVQQLSDSGKYGLQQLWEGINDVSTIRTGLTSQPTVSAFRQLTNPPTIQELFTGGFPLQQLWNGIVTTNRSDDVATIYDGLDVNPSVSDWWELTNGKPTVQQLSDSGKYTLQQLWNGINNVSTIRTGLTPAPTVSDFRQLTNAPTIQHLFDGGYVLQDLWNGIVTSNRSDDVASIHDGLTVKPTVAEWWALTNGKPTVQQLSDSGKYGLQQLWTGINDVSTIRTGLTPAPTVSDFKALISPPTIQHLFDGGYDLSKLIEGLVTVEQVITGVTPLQTIQNFKDARAPILQVFQQYKTVGAHRLSTMIQTGYTVADIVIGVTGVTVDPAIGIADFKDASAPIQDVFNKYGLNAMIAAFYTVDQVVGGVTPLQTITDFKAASASIQQVFTKYGLSPMIGEGYIVSDVKTGVTSTTLSYSDFVQALAEPWNLMTQFDYNLLLPNFTVSQIYAASSDSRVKVSNKNLDAQSFKTYSAQIWQMLNTFQLNILTPLYTTRQLFDASNEKDGSQNFLVTVQEYQDLTAEDMKGAQDALWEMMNVYSLADLLQLDYSVADLVTASNDNRVTVADLQNLGTTTAITGGLARFFTANATIIGRTNGVSKLWNLVNYFDLSDLLGYYSVAQLNATSTDNRVSQGKKVTIARLKAADTAETYTQDMLTEFGLHALWDNQYTVSQLKPFKVDVNTSETVTVAQFWALRTYTEENHVNPTVQDLSTGGYVLQDLWNGISDVATIYDGLTVKPTVAEWWALTNGKPTVQQLSDSGKYGLQQLWTGINDVSTIRTGLTPAPTVSQFKALTNPPTVKLLSLGGYNLAELIAALYTVAQIRNTITGIGNTYEGEGGPGRQQSPTLAELKAASAPLWQLLSLNYYITPQNGSMRGFPLGHYIKCGYSIQELVQESRLKDSSNVFLVADDADFKNLQLNRFHPDAFFYLSDTNQEVRLTTSEKMDFLCDILSYFEPGELLNYASDSASEIYYRVPKIIEASKLKDDLGNYKVTKVDNRDLDINMSRFITGTNTTRTGSGVIQRLLRYRSLFTPFSITDLEAAYSISELFASNAYYNDTGSAAWDSQNDWRITFEQLKSAPVPTSRMIQYYTPRVGGLQTLWNGYYILSELRIASDLVFPVYYEYSVSVQKLLALSSDTTVNRAKPTIREIQVAGYSLERLTAGMLGGSLDPLIADVTGMSPAPTVADFYSQISRESEKRPTIQQLYNTFGLQTLFDNLTVFDGVSPNRGMNLIKTSLSPQTTVAQWLGLTSKPTVQQLFSNGQYGLQELWDGIADVETIYNGLATKPTVAQWWALTPGKPTVYQLSVIYGLQELWNGISSVATIKSGISPTVTQWWALGPKPTIDQLFLGSYSLQELWDYFASVSVVYDALSSKPTVAQWWALSTNTILHLLKPTVAQLSVRYVLRDLWGGIVSANRADDVAIIKAGLTVPPTVAEWTALTPTPTVNQLYGGGYVVAELISGNTGIQISDVLSAVSGPSNSTSISIVNNLKSVGYKINMPAPRIRAASYNSGSVNLTVFQRSADVAVEKYLFSYSNNGGQTWSEYAVVTDSTSSAAEKPPLLLNGSNILIISGFTATNKLNSFRIKAEGSEIQSTTSNTFKNVFF